MTMIYLEGAMEVFKIIMDSGGTFGLAIFSIYILNKVWELRLEDTKRYAEEVRELRNATYRALENNTKVMQMLIAKLEEG